MGGGDDLVMWVSASCHSGQAVESPWAQSDSSEWIGKKFQVFVDLSVKYVTDGDTEDTDDKS